MSPRLQQLSHPYCGHCGYDLRATGVGNRCPECGKFSDAEELVIWADASQVTGSWLSLDRTTVKAVAISLVCTVIIIVGVPLLANAAIGSSINVVCLTLPLLFVNVVVVMGVMIWRSLPPKLGLRGAYQVRLSSAGYGARHGFGEMPRRPWFRDMSVRVGRTPKRFGTKSFQIFRSGEWLPAFGFDLETDWDTARDLAHQIGNWIESAPKASDHRDASGTPVVVIDRSTDGLD